MSHQIDDWDVKTKADLQNLLQVMKQEVNWENISYEHGGLWGNDEDWNGINISWLPHDYRCNDDFEPFNIWSYAEPIHEYDNLPRYVIAGKGKIDCWQIYDLQELECNHWVRKAVWGKFDKSKGLSDDIDINEIEDEPTIYMFHFRCPLCGGQPEEVPLRDYLKDWSNCENERVISLLGIFREIMSELQISNRRRRQWLSNDFNIASSYVIEILDEILLDYFMQNDTHLFKYDSDNLFFDIECPVCLSPPGVRTVNSYFHHWSDACKVQIGNLLYEIGLIIWTIIKTNSEEWSSQQFLITLERLRLAIYSNGKSIDKIMECPYCGRLTTALYGDSEENGYCRWCNDMAGGTNLLTEVDPSIPVKSCLDILPPEVVNRNTHG